MFSTEVAGFSIDYCFLLVARWGGHIQVLVERGCTAGLWSGTILYICSVLCVLLETIWENWQLLSVQGDAFEEQYVVARSNTVRNVFPTLLSTFYFRPRPPLAPLVGEGNKQLVQLLTAGPVSIIYRGAPGWLWIGLDPTY